MEQTDIPHCGDEEKGRHKPKNSYTLCIVYGHWQ